jgi:hypothetical protein
MNFSHLSMNFSTELREKFPFGQAKILVQTYVRQTKNFK